MYLANNTRSDIVFAVNYLTRHSATPTMHHILHYLNVTIDLDLFFQRNQESDLIRYADVGYLSDHKMADHKQYSCFYMEGLLYHGSLQNRL
jgi:hypothetical protein